MFNKEHILTIKSLCLKLFIIFFLYSLMCSCAPKQIKIYQQADGIRNEIVQYAISLLGKPYKSGAKGPNSFDCSGFIHYTYKKFGIILPVMTEGLLKVGYNTSKNNILPGDIVFFRIKKNLHSGMMINKIDFIHSSTSRGVTIDNIGSKYWQGKLIGFKNVL